MSDSLDPPDIVAIAAGGDVAAQGYRLPVAACVYADARLLATERIA